MFDVLLLVAVPLVPQTTGPAPAPAPLCNNQTRHITTMAGNTSTGTANCASFSFTITIAGQSFTFSSPASCDTGRREQDKDCYDCGPASQGNHCKARGFKANVKIYSIGGGSPCPTIPDPLPTTLEGASAAVQCAPLPLISSEDNWCASVSTCDETPQQQREPRLPLVLGDGRGARSHWSGTSIDLDWSGAAPRSEFEGWFRSLPRQPLEALPPVMQASLGDVGDLEAAEVVGLLEVHYFEDGVPWITNRFDFTALVRRGGLHVREREFVPDQDGEVTPRVESLIHDGRTLLVESEGGTVGQAYLPGYYDLPAVVRARIAPYALLETWLDGPMGVHRLVGTKYESILDDRGRTIVIETYPDMQGPGTEGSTVYRFGGHDALPRLESVEYRAGDGTLRVVREFSSWLEISEGVLRPGRVVERRHAPSGELEVVRTLQVRSMQAMTQERARAGGWLTPRAGEWLVYQ